MSDEANIIPNPPGNSSTQINTGAASSLTPGQARAQAILASRPTTSPSAVAPETSLDPGSARAQAVLAARAAAPPAVAPPATVAAASVPPDVAPSASAPPDVSPPASAPSTTAPAATAPPTTEPIVPEVSPSQSLPPLDYRFVVFGKELFDLKFMKQEPIFGSPGILTRSDFRDRFGENESVVAKYWHTLDSSITGRPISEPTTNFFRIPCDGEDISLMIDAFNQYKTKVEDKISKHDGKESTQKDSLDELSKRIDVYLKILSNPTTTQIKQCINESELNNDKPSEPLDTMYYPVLPRIFYLLYMRSKGKKGLKFFHSIQL